jgi:hypothetical protein
MLNYQAIGPDEAGDYLIGYPTPGAPHVFTAAGSASSEQGAKAECARLNEAQAVDRRAALLRRVNMIILDEER